LANLHAVLKRRGVGIAAISVDSQEDSAKLSQSLELPFPLLEDANLQVALQWGVAMEGRDIAVPAVFVVLPNGTIFWKQVGENVTDRPSNAQILDVTSRARAASQQK
jgi:peroxiredoxin